ncbi:hypothetical protein INT47_010254 [Mucor saturninus]|uniref:Uncharacterized protein n=1 Tax=Mucor saturninus TaxID=64648 RepID=A0A8H7RF38_9FUNG|nr:hypothetical protein INT47_010254 [Mucor saturninus]
MHFLLWSLVLFQAIFLVRGNILSDIITVVENGQTLYNWFSSTFLKNEYDQLLTASSYSDGGSVWLVTIGTEDGHVLYNLMLDKRNGQSNPGDCLRNAARNAYNHNQKWSQLESSLDSCVDFLGTYQKKAHVTAGQPWYTTTTCQHRTFRICTNRRDIYISYSLQGELDWTTSTLNTWDRDNSKICENNNRRCNEGK